MPSHRFNSATGEQKGIIQTIYTDPELSSRLPNSLMPSAKLRSINISFLRLWCDAVGDRTPPSRTPSGRSNHCATRGRSHPRGKQTKLWASWSYEITWVKFGVIQYTFLQIGLSLKKTHCRVKWIKFGHWGCMSYAYGYFWTGTWRYKLLHENI